MPNTKSKKTNGAQNKSHASNNGKTKNSNNNGNASKETQS